MRSKRAVGEEAATCRDRRPLFFVVASETTGPFHTDGGALVLTIDDTPPGSLPGGVSRPADERAQPASAQRAPRLIAPWHPRPHPAAC